MKISALTEWYGRMSEWRAEVLPNGFVLVRSMASGTEGLLDPETREWRSVSPVPYGADPAQFVDGILAKVETVLSLSETIGAVRLFASARLAHGEEYTFTMDGKRFRVVSDKEGENG